MGKSEEGKNSQVLSLVRSSRNRDQKHKPQTETVLGSIPSPMTSSSLTKPHSPHHKVENVQQPIPGRMLTSTQRDRTRNTGYLLRQQVLPGMKYPVRKLWRWMVKGDQKTVTNLGQRTREKVEQGCQKKQRPNICLSGSRQSSKKYLNSLNSQLFYTSLPSSSHTVLWFFKASWIVWICMDTADSTDSSSLLNSSKQPQAPHFTRPTKIRPIDFTSMP